MSKPFSQPSTQPGLQSPNIRKIKSLLANKVTKVIKDFHLTKDDDVDVLALSLEQFGIFDQIKFCKTRHQKVGVYLTSTETCQAV